MALSICQYLPLHERSRTFAASSHSRNALTAVFRPVPFATRKPTLNEATMTVQRLALITPIAAPPWLSKPPTKVACHCVFGDTHEPCRVWMRWMRWLSWWLPAQPGRRPRCLVRRLIK